MKQTVEEAAKEYIYKARASFVGITPEEYEEQINPEYPYNVGTDEDFESLFIAGADWQKERTIEALSSVLDNWVHGGDADCIIAEFEEKLKIRLKSHERKYI